MEFTGLSAFPLTPLREGRADVDACGRIVAHLAAAGVDSIGVLGSTGAGVYLSREERSATVRRSVESAAGTPVLAGVSALRTADVLDHARDAADAGAAGLLLSAMTYQPLTEDEVVGLYADVCAETSLPVVLYDNPTTTGVTMTPRTYARIAALAAVTDVKIPGLPLDEVGMRERLAGLRAAVPAGTGLGISGDAVAVTGLLAGCDAWYSVVAGTLPELAVPLTRAALSGEAEEQEWARAETARLEPLWELFRRHGSLRVVAALAALRGWADVECLPRPVRPLPADARDEVAGVARGLALH